MKLPILKQSTGAAIICLFGLIFAFSHCAHQQGTAEDPDRLFAEAEEEFKDERYLIAIEKYRDIKNRFPYSNRSVDSELRIADAYFEQESFLEAESGYEIFRELHPTHNKSDYVQYRIGLSYFRLIPDNSARDLSAAYRAIDSFNTLVERFPNSEYVAAAKQQIIDSRRKLAEHENYVADFYFQRKHYLSATYRYSALLQDYPKLGYDKEALWRLVQCYYNTHMFDNAKNTILRLLSLFPKSEFEGSAQAMLEQINNKKN